MKSTEEPLMGWADWSKLALLLLFIAPVTLFAQSGNETDWIIQNQAPITEKLDLTLKVSPQPLIRGHVHEAIIQVTNGTTREQQVAIKALLGEVAHFVTGEQGVVFANPHKAEQERTIVWPTLSLPSRATGRVSFQFLASWDVSGDVYLEVYADSLGEDGPLEVARLREAPQYPDGTGGFLQQYGSMVIFVILMIVLQIGIKRYMRNRRNVGILKILSIVGAALFFLIGFSVIWDALEPWTHWQATTCEVLDVRYSVSTTTHSTGGTSRVSGKTTTTTILEPLLTLRFQVPESERTIVSTGFRNSSVSSEDIGLLKKYQAGTPAECYYDPADPGWVVVERSFSGFTIGLATGCLLTSAFLAWLGLRRRNNSDQSE